MDCACGSGIQIAAYSAIFKRPALGIELNPQRARASAVNFRNIFKIRGGDAANILQKSLFLAADGRDGTGAIEKLETANNEQVKSLFYISILQDREIVVHTLSMK